MTIQTGLITYAAKTIKFALLNINYAESDINIGADRDATDNFRRKTKDFAIQVLPFKQSICPASKLPLWISRV